MATGGARIAPRTWPFQRIFSGLQNGTCKFEWPSRTAHKANTRDPTYCRQEQLKMRPVLQSQTDLNPLTHDDDPKRVPPQCVLTYVSG
jgi:hypothetical protein